MKPFVVSFSGNDGTGKSTLAREVCRYLNQHGQRAEYYEFFKHFLLKTIFSLLSSETKFVYRKNFNDLNKRRNILERLWPFIILFESLTALGYFRIFKRNRIIVFDRYFCDYLVSYEILGLKSRIFDFFSRLIPSPEVRFILDVDLQTVWRRKKDDPSFEEERFNLLRERYLAKANKLGVKPIDTSFTKESVIREILPVIENKIKI